VHRSDQIALSVSIRLRLSYWDLAINQNERRCLAVPYNRRQGKDFISVLGSKNYLLFILQDSVSQLVSYVLHLYYLSHFGIGWCNRSDGIGVQDQYANGACLLIDGPWTKVLWTGLQNLIYGVSWHVCIGYRGRKLLV
jgi:hypothetical protein